MFTGYNILVCELLYLGKAQITVKKSESLYNSNLQSDEMWCLIELLFAAKHKYEIWT